MSNQPPTSSVTEERLQRERDYHNDAFANDVRAVADKYYSTVKRCFDDYDRTLLNSVAGKSVLEYGCGPGSRAFAIAKAGAHVTGIDISDVAIKMAAKKAEAAGVKATFAVMNAEALEAGDDSFDKIVGSAILHHLDLDASYSEIVRCLKPDGVGVFVEPMGHNPVINLYRNLTPKLRTEDEHPLLFSDITLAKKYFENVVVRYYNLTSTGAFLFEKTPVFKPILGLLDALDKGLFSILPPIRRWAWYCVIELHGPKKQ